MTPNLKFVHGSHVPRNSAHMFKEPTKYPNHHDPVSQFVGFDATDTDNGFEVRVDPISSNQAPVDWYAQTAINHFKDDYPITDIPMYPATGLLTLGMLHPNPGQIWPTSHPNMNKKIRYSNAQEMIIKGVSKNKARYLVSGIPALPLQIKQQS